MRVQSRGRRWPHVVAAVVATIALVGSGAAAASAESFEDPSTTASVSESVAAADAGASASGDSAIDPVVVAEEAGSIASMAAPVESVVTAAAEEPILIPRPHVIFWRVSEDVPNINPYKYVEIEGVRVDPNGQWVSFANYTATFIPSNDAGTYVLLKPDEGYYFSGVPQLYVGEGESRIIPDPVDPVVVAGTPSVSGTPRVGAPLTADAGVWGPAPVELSYQWSVAGTSVAGATGATFIPDAAHVGQQVTVTVTGTKPGHTSATEVSAPTAAVAAGALSVGDLLVTGLLGVGSELVVSASAWGPAPLDRTYQWLADGEPVEGATGDRFTPDESLVGAELSVMVSATKPGYEPAERTVLVGTLPPSVTASASRAQVGDEIVVIGEYFVPGEEVLLQLHSDPIDLTAVVANEQGAFSVAVVIPASAETGQHQIVAVGQQSGRTTSVPLEVYGNSTAPGGGSTAGGSTAGDSAAGGLAHTGGELPTLAVSLGLMMVAAGLVLARRCRVIG